MNTLPFHHFLVVIWNVATQLNWSMPFVAATLVGSLCLMVLQIIAMVMLQQQTSFTGYPVAMLFVGASAGLPFALSWFMAQIVVGLSVQFMQENPEHTSADFQDGADVPQVLVDGKESGTAGGRRAANPLTVTDWGVSGKHTAPSPSSHKKSMSRQGSLLSPLGEAGTPKASQLRSETQAWVQWVNEHALGITRMYAVVLWLLWAVQIWSFFTFAGGCVDTLRDSRALRNETLPLGVDLRFTCMAVNDNANLDPAGRNALTGQLWQLIINSVVLLSMWCMPPKAPFVPHPLLKVGVLCFSVSIYAVLSYAALFRPTYAARGTTVEVLIVFAERVLSCIFAVLGVLVAFPPLTFFFPPEQEEEDEEEEEPKDAASAEAGTKNTTGNPEAKRQEFLRVSKRAMEALNPAERGVCSNICSWCCAGLLLLLLIIFAGRAMMPLSGGTFILEWVELGGEATTRLSLYELFLPMCVVSPMLWVLFRRVMLTMVRVHELVHTVYATRHFLSWLSRFVVSPCCEMTCFTCCCCYCCCPEARDSACRRNCGCASCGQCWKHSPFVECLRDPTQDIARPKREQAPSAPGAAKPSQTVTSVATAGKLRYRSRGSPQGTELAGRGDMKAGAAAPQAPPASESTLDGTFLTDEEPALILKLLREGLSESDVLAGVTCKHKRSSALTMGLKGLGAEARRGQPATDTAAAIECLDNLAVVDLEDDDQFVNLLQALLPPNMPLWTGPPTGTRGAKPTPMRKGKTLRQQKSTKSLVLGIRARDSTEIVWVPVAVWVACLIIMLIPGFLRLVLHQSFWHGGTALEGDDAATATSFSVTRLTLMMLLGLVYCIVGVYRLKSALRILHRIRTIVYAAVSLEVHAGEWNLPYEARGAAQWSARLLFASRFITAQFSGSVSGFIGGFMVGTVLAAAALAIFILIGLDFPSALSHPEMYCCAAVVVLYAVTGMYMLWQLVQTDGIIYTSIRDVSVLSARGGVVDTYRLLLRDYSRSLAATSPSSAGARQQGGPHRLGQESPAEVARRDASSFAQLLAMTWQQRYPGVQITFLEGAEWSKITISKSSITALITGGIVSGLTAGARALESVISSGALNSHT